MIILFSMCCDTLCVHLHVLFDWVFCSHSQSVVWQFFSSQPKLVPTLRKNHQSSDHDECLEFPLLVFQLFRSQFVDEDEAVGRSPRDSLEDLQPVRGSTAQFFSSIHTDACTFRCLTCCLRGTVLFLLSICHMFVV